MVVCLSLLEMKLLIVSRPSCMKSFLCLRGGDVSRANTEIDHLRTEKVFLKALLAFVSAISISGKVLLLS